MMNDELLGIEAGTPAAESVRHSLLMTAMYVTLVFADSLLSKSAVGYTVASIYAGKEFCYRRVMSIVPRVWKRLILAFVYFFLILFLYTVVIVVAIFFWGLICGAAGLKEGTFFVGFFVIFIVAFSFHVYFAMLWQLASVVCVVEDRQRLNAIKKSKQLMKGKQVTALMLNILYVLIMGVIGGIQIYSPYGKGQQMMSVGVVVAVVVFQCVVDLVWLLTNAVLTSCANHITVRR